MLLYMHLHAKHTSKCSTTYVMQCVSIKPDWGKGYSRLSAAHFGKAKYDEAIQAAEEGEVNCDDTFTKANSEKCKPRLLLACSLCVVKFAFVLPGAWQQLLFLYSTPCFLPAKNVSSWMIC